MDISTPLACANKKRVNCVTQNDSNTYNLTSLALLNKNYVIKDGNLDYILNLCNPVINTDSTLCPGLSGICLRNNSEPNIKKK